MYELQVNLEDPKRYRLEMTFSRGADLSPLEVIYFQQKVSVPNHIPFFHTFFFFF